MACSTRLPSIPTRSIAPAEPSRLPAQDPEKLSTFFTVPRDASAEALETDAARAAEAQGAVHHAAEAIEIGDAA